jgi:hypothetical protein
MGGLKKYSWLLWCAVAWAAVVGVEQFPDQIERWYSRGVFLQLSTAQRWLLGWLPFSLGDVAYALLIAFAVYKMCRLVWRLCTGSAHRAVWQRNLRFWIKLITVAYVWFYVAWGFNYYRLGSSHQLQLLAAEYCTPDVDTLAVLLTGRLRTLCADTASLQYMEGYPRAQMLLEAQKGYAAAAIVYPFLNYRFSSVKPTLMGQSLNYFGTLGYANPFTAEAQINYSMPRSLWPYTICHEMAHQLGYASEADANLIGYLACKANGSAPFAYSVYASLQAYALSELYQLDSGLAARRHTATPAYVTADRQRMRQFFNQYQNPFESIIFSIYEHYLKANNQPMGHKSYNYVVAWLIAFGKKYGWQYL